MSVKFRLCTIPARSLVPAPRRCDSDECKNDRLNHFQTLVHLRGQMRWRMGLVQVMSDFDAGATSFWHIRYSQLLGLICCSRRSLVWLAAVESTLSCKTVRLLP